MMPVSRKAVSPLIATLLLVLISIAAASLIYVFVTGYISGSAGQRPTAQSQIVIEAASLKPDDDKINVTVYVRNVGQQEIPSGNWSIYLYDLNGNMVGYNLTNIASSLGPGSLLQINAKVTTTSSDSYYDVKVVSPVGTFDVVRVKAS
jgi:flagellin-like protein